MTDLFAATGALPAIPILVAQDVILLGYGLFLPPSAASHRSGRVTAHGTRCL